MMLRISDGREKKDATLDVGLKDEGKLLVGKYWRNVRLCAYLIGSARKPDACTRVSYSGWFHVRQQYPKQPNQRSLKSGIAEEESCSHRRWF